jgi:Rad3-related DNA helicase
MQKPVESSMGIKTIDSLKTALEKLTNLYDKQNLTYKNLILLNEREVFESNDQTEDTTYAYRLSISLSEIYKNMIIEKVCYFGEGGKQIIKQINVKVDSLLLSGEHSSGLSFVNWITPKSFKFNLYERSYALTIEDNEKIKIDEIKNIL